MDLSKYKEIPQESSCYNKKKKLVNKSERCPFCHKNEAKITIEWNSDWCQGSVDVNCTLEGICYNGYCSWRIHEYGSIRSYNEFDPFLIIKLSNYLDESFYINKIEMLRNKLKLSKPIKDDKHCPICGNDKIDIFAYTDDLESYLSISCSDCDFWDNITGECDKTKKELLQEVLDKNYYPEKIGYLQKIDRISS